MAGDECINIPKNCFLDAQLYSSQAFLTEEKPDGFALEVKMISQTVADDSFAAAKATI